VQLSRLSPDPSLSWNFEIGIRNLPSGQAFEARESEHTLNIYVGNLSYDTTESDLNRTFTSYGAVASARLATDRDTGRTRGFGFVEMTNEAEAKAAISALNGTELQGRTLTVNESKPREAGSQNYNSNRGGNSNRGYSGERSRW
jgi:cold-inducible RNA-binding protein